MEWPPSNKTIAQTIVLMKALVETGALKEPLVVSLAVGDRAGWRLAAMDWLVSKAKGVPYDGQEYKVEGYWQELSCELEAEGLKEAGRGAS